MSLFGNPDPKHDDDTLPYLPAISMAENPNPDAYDDVEPQVHETIILKHPSASESDATPQS